MGQLSPTFCVLGAGSWGTALAVQLARCGNAVRLWGRDADAVRHMATQRCNARYLPDTEFPETLTPVPDLADALTGADEIVVVVPSTALGDMFRRVLEQRHVVERIAWATKGLEPKTGRLAEDVAREILGDTVTMAVVSGPTFAKEVAAGLPTAMTVAANSENYANRLAAAFHGGSLRAYTSVDMTGVEVGGAAKNVIAIATGISDGLGFGANARAALVTRGLAEIMRLGEHLGARRDTFMGLAGMGDLVLTCTDDQSRNRRTGLALAEGLNLEQARERIGQVVEGAYAASEIHALAGRLGVDMPITEQVYRVLYEGVSPQQACQTLLERERKPEL